MLAWIWAHLACYLAARQRAGGSMAAGLGQRTAAPLRYFRESAPPPGAPQWPHGAWQQGPEFPVVFLCDLEEGILPSYACNRPSRLVARVAGLAA